MTSIESLDWYQNYIKIGDSQEKIATELLFMVVFIVDVLLDS